MADSALPVKPLPINPGSPDPYFNDEPFIADLGCTDSADTMTRISLDGTRE